ncbi:MAG: sialate O-acetylesterase [Planctomycetota bacterium]
MVLQRGSTVKVWGTAEANQELVVKFDKQEIKVAAGGNGNWQSNIQTPRDAGGPFELEVGSTSGDLKVVFSDVMVGEVWICAGDSNMDHDLSQVLNSENEIELSKNFQQIRLFSVDPDVSAQSLTDFQKVQPWSVCSPETVKEFSATAYFFGRELSKELPNVPIGLIELSSPGAPIESWCSAQSLKEIDVLNPLFEHWSLLDDPNNIRRPGTAFNAMVTPLADLPVAGVVWHQGETNIGRANQYSTLLPAMIDNWRKCFKNADLTFLIVQLHPFRHESLSTESLPEMWDVQRRVAAKDPHAHLIVTGDIGDTQQRFPKNKQEVGRRLALLGRHTVYAEHLPPVKQVAMVAGPVFSASEATNEGIEIRFLNCKDGLKLKDGDSEITGFMICGEDKKFVPAKAEIVGNKIRVSSSDVKFPQQVRYCWEDTAQPNVFNSLGLPVAPFRTDDFELQSVGSHF